MAPKPPPTAAPMPAPCPPPAIAPITAPVPAPSRPPPIARSPGLYGSAKADAVSTNPAPITLATVDCFLIRFLPTSPWARDRISVEGGRLASSPTKQTNDQGFGSVPWVATQLQSLLTLIRPAQAVTGFSAAFSARNSANTLLATIIDSRMIGTPT